MIFARSRHSERNQEERPVQGLRTSGGQRRGGDRRWIHDRTREPQSGKEATESWVRRNLEASPRTQLLTGVREQDQFRRPARVFGLNRVCELATLV